MQVYVIGTWSYRDSGGGQMGNMPSFTVDHPTVSWVDVTDQWGPNIADGHLVVLKAEVTTAELTAIEQDTNYEVFSVDGEITSEEKSALDKHSPDIEKLPANATRSQAKDVLVELFKTQGES